MKVLTLRSRLTTPPDTLICRLLIETEIGFHTYKSSYKVDLWSMIHSHEWERVPLNLFVAWQLWWNARLATGVREKYGVKITLCKISSKYRDREDTSEMDSQQPYVAEILPTLMYFILDNPFCQISSQDEWTCSFNIRKSLKAPACSGNAD